MQDAGKAVVVEAVGCGCSGVQDKTAVVVFVVTVDVACMMAGRSWWLSLWLLCKVEARLWICGGCSYVCCDMQNDREGCDGCSCGG